MNIPESLPQLAKGNHGRGSGKACIMNAISYLNGDTVITDFPDCSDAVLAALAQVINDRICTSYHHLIPFVQYIAPSETKFLGEFDVPDNKVLCSECSGVMWKLGSRLIGTRTREYQAVMSYKTLFDDEAIMWESIIANATSTGVFFRKSWEAYPVVKHIQVSEDFNAQELHRIIDAYEEYTGIKNHREFTTEDIQLICEGAKL